MSRYARVVASLDMDTGLPEDRIVNVTHWIGAESLAWAAASNELADRVNLFYANIDAVLSATVASTMTVQVYDMEDPEPRIPKYEETYSNLTPAATSLPTEVALCISYAGLEVSGLNQARRRGRAFIGPFAISESVILNNRARPSTGLRNLLGDEWRAMCLGPTADDFRLAVFSPTIAHELDPLGGAWTESVLVEATTPVTQIWIDNAWDTQRRRGNAPDTRTFFVPS